MSETAKPKTLAEIAKTANAAPSVPQAPKKPSPPNLNVLHALRWNQQLDSLHGKVVKVLTGRGTTVTGICIAPPAHNPAVAIQTDEGKVVVRDWVQIECPHRKTAALSTPSAPSEQDAANKKESP